MSLQDRPVAAEWKEASGTAATRNSWALKDGSLVSGTRYEAGAGSEEGVVLGHGGEGRPEAAVAVAGGVAGGAGDLLQGSHGGGAGGRAWRHLPPGTGDTLEQSDKTIKLRLLGVNEKLHTQHISGVTSCKPGG